MKFGSLATVSRRDWPWNFPKLKTISPLAHLRRPVRSAQAGSRGIAVVVEGIHIGGQFGVFAELAVEDPDGGEDIAESVVRIVVGVAAIVAEGGGKIAGFVAEEDALGVEDAAALDGEGAVGAGELLGQQRDVVAENIVAGQIGAGEVAVEDFGHLGEGGGTFDIGIGDAVDGGGFLGDGNAGIEQISGSARCGAEGS